MKTSKEIYEELWYEAQAVKIKQFLKHASMYAPWNLPPKPKKKFVRRKK